MDWYSPLRRDARRKGGAEVVEGVAGAGAEDGDQSQKRTLKTVVRNPLGDSTPGGGRKKGKQRQGRD